MAGTETTRLINEPELETLNGDEVVYVDSLSQGVKQLPLTAVGNMLVFPGPGGHTYGIRIINDSGGNAVLDLEQLT